jgi:uncharacterized protein (DUF1697 family)
VSGPPKPYVALLRGVNLGARNKVPMAELRRRLTALGFLDVTTYIQSGNVVLWAAGTTEAKVGAAIERAVKQGFGVTAAVLVRTRAELSATASKNPLLRRGVDPKSLHVTFLASKPTAARVRALHDQAFSPDEHVVRGREVYLRCPNGYGRSKLGNAFLEQALGTTATTRNWTTVGTLLELASGRAPTGR